MSGEKEGTELNIKTSSWDWSHDSRSYVVDEEQYFAKEWIGEDLYASAVKFRVHIFDSAAGTFTEDFYFYSQAKEFMDKHLSLGDCAVMKRI